MHYLARRDTRLDASSGREEHLRFEAVEVGLQALRCNEGAVGGEWARGRRGETRGRWPLSVVLVQTALTFMTAPAPEWLSS